MDSNEAEPRQLCDDAGSRAELHMGEASPKEGMTTAPSECRVFAWVRERSLPETTAPPASASSSAWPWPTTSAPASPRLPPGRFDGVRGNSSLSQDIGWSVSNDDVELIEDSSSNNEFDKEAVDSDDAVGGAGGAGGRGGGVGESAEGVDGDERSGSGGAGGRVPQTTSEPQPQKSRNDGGRDTPASHPRPPLSAPPTGRKGGRGGGGGGGSGRFNRSTAQHRFADKYKHAPRLSTNAFFNFLGELRDQLQDVPQTIITKQGARVWRKMTFLEKQPYFKMVEIARRQQSLAGGQPLAGGPPS